MRCYVLGDVFFFVTDTPDFHLRRWAVKLLNEEDPLAAAQEVYNHKLIEMAVSVAKGHLVLVRRSSFWQMENAACHSYAKMLPAHTASSFV